jgi:hypothetical protein
VDIHDGIPFHHVLPAGRAHASPREQRDPVCGNPTRREVRRGEHLVADLEREISRLRNELAWLRAAARAASLERGPQVEDRRDRDREPAVTPETYARKSYAVDPIGKVGPAPLGPAPTPPPDAVESNPWVTNLGTLIDVLA